MKSLCEEGLFVFQWWTRYSCGLHFVLHICSLIFIIFLFFLLCINWYMLPFPIFFCCLTFFLFHWLFFCSFKITCNTYTFPSFLQVDFFVCLAISFFFLLMSMMFLILSVTMFYKLFLISCSTTCFTLILLSLFILLCLFFDLLAMSLFPL